MQTAKELMLDYIAGTATFAGGLPLRGVDGQLPGSIGVSGGQVEQDFDVARAARAAFAE